MTTLTINHDTRRLRTVSDAELCAYIDGCMTKAYAMARANYREEMQEMLEAQVRNMPNGLTLRLPLPVKDVAYIGNTRRGETTERMSCVEFTADHVRAFSHFMTGTRA